jgi:hypothetical protein
MFGYACACSSSPPLFASSLEAAYLYDLFYADTSFCSGQIWKVDTDEENRKVEYMSTLAKHTQAVNVVRWAPRGRKQATHLPNLLTLLSAFVLTRFRLRPYR